MDKTTIPNFTSPLSVAQICKSSFLLWDDSIKYIQVLKEAITITLIISGLNAFDTLYDPVLLGLERKTNLQKFADSTLASFQRAKLLSCVKKAWSRCNVYNSTP